MKNILLLVALLTVGSAFAQSSTNTAAVNNQQQFLRAAADNTSAFGTSLVFYNPKREIKGSVYLFDNWNNTSVFSTITGQQYKVKNVNINLKQQIYVSKYEQDSIFVFSFNDIDKFYINNKVYKNYFYDEDNRIYQIVHESKEFSILKGFDLEIIEGSANPMLNRKADKYKKSDRYYLKTENNIKPFKLKKNKVLKLVAKTDEEKDKLEDYASENNLSFRKDFDVDQILKYSQDN